MDSVEIKGWIFLINRHKAVLSGFNFVLHYWPVIGQNPDFVQVSIFTLQYILHGFGNGSCDD